MTKPSLERIVWNN